MARIAAALGYRLLCSYKRKWILMSIFICIPILLSMIFMVTKAKGGIMGQSGSREEGPIIPLPLTRSQVLQMCTSLKPIVVSPDNNSTKRLMEAARRIFPSQVNIDPIVYLRTPEEVAEYLANTTQGKGLFGDFGYGINFNELTNRNLSYVLRSILAENWFTDQGYPSSMVPGPMDVGDYYLTRGFVALQVAINEAYMQTFLNMTSPDWSLQAFPYPKYQKEDAYAILYLIMGYVNSYGLTFLLVRFSVMMIQEKASGIKELLKINGIQTWMVYGSWYFMFGLITFFIAIVVTIVWKFPLSDYGAVLPQTNPVMLLIILTIYYWSALASVGFVSSLINDPKYGTLFVIIYWIGSGMLISQVLTSFRTLTTLVIFALLPNGGLFGIFEAIAEFEAAGSGAGFANLFSSPPASKKILPIGLNLLIMIFSIFLYLMLMAYIGAIKPGPYGRARPWHFIFHTRFWSRVQAEKVEILSGDDGASRSLIEPVGNEAVGLETVNLLKVFGSLVSVDHLNLKIYKNQITALLGHNGAGKSTLFSMISGMYSPTSGSVQTGEYDIFQGDNLERFRRALGFCPQHDLLIDELSVEQHLIFFGMVKGLSFAEAKVQSEHWTNKFKIYEGRHKQVAELSGGMKRKLCLSIALVGNPQWLLLDEPTSGLDPESRRDIWDVLLTIRGNRTIVISTHFMEEADVLGDRIAIIAHGKLKCYGTSMFLKRHYGSGYQMNFTTNTGVKGLMNEIKKHVVSATLINETETTLSVGLPASEVKKFPDLFRGIEAKYGNSVDSSLSCTTMDDVFLKVQEDEGVQMTIDEVDMPTMMREANDLRDKQTRGFKIWQQMEGFFIKRYKWAFYNWPSFLVFMVLCPVLGSWMVMAGCNNAQQTNVIDELAISLDTYEDSLVLGNTKLPSDPLLNAFEKATLASGSTYKKVSSYSNMSSALLGYAEQDLLYYRSKMVVALDTVGSINVLHSTLAYHAIPVAYSMLANALANSQGKSTVIQTYNYPYKFNEGNCTSAGATLMVQMMILWIVLGFTILVSSSYFVIFPHTERITQIKHLQLMTGAHPIVYWLTTFLADFTIYMLPLVISLVMIVVLDTFKIFSYCILFGTLTLVLILFGVGGILFSYFCSYFFKTYTSSMELCIFLSTIPAVISLVGSLFDETDWFPYVFNLLPWIPFVKCLIKIVEWASKVAICSTCKVGTYAALCKALVDDATVSSFDMKTELIYLAVDPLVYLVIIMSIEAGLFRTIVAKLNACLYGPIIASTETPDPDVAKEKELVNATTMDFGRDGTPPIFICDHLGKKFSRSLTATYDVAFTIQKGECFGLLGVNGAGKSTTFGMLTGSIIPSRGDARIMKYSLFGNRRQYLKRLGYCPQLDGLLPGLSARSLLSLFGRLRGVPSSQLRSITQKWIDALDMTNICDRPCQHYSGGNKRKLSTAMALIADPPVVLLDEPTTGVDPVIRRKIWAILKHCRDANGQTVIITSHSMDECEAVCGRLTIMVNGHMKCIGSVPRLKTVYGQGYILLVKLVFSCVQERADEVQSRIDTVFSPNIRLQDKQHGLFNFHITSRSVKLHYIFDVMLDLKAKYDVIEDFSLSDISLEQVFLSLAKDK